MAPYLSFNEASRKDGYTGHRFTSFCLHRAGPQFFMVESFMFSTYKITFQERRKKGGNSRMGESVAIVAKGVNLINLDPNGDASLKCVTVLASPYFQFFKVNS